MEGNYYWVMDWMVYVQYGVSPSFMAAALLLWMEAEALIELEKHCQ